jgi:hypothetical protein
VSSFLLFGNLILTPDNRHHHNKKLEKCGVAMTLKMGFCNLFDPTVVCRQSTDGTSQQLWNAEDLYPRRRSLAL